MSPCQIYLNLFKFFSASKLAAAQGIFSLPPSAQTSPSAITTPSTLTNNKLQGESDTSEDEGLTKGTFTII